MLFMLLSELLLIYRVEFTGSLKRFYVNIAANIVLWIILSIVLLFRLLFFSFHTRLL